MKPKPLEGALEMNDFLGNPEKLYEGKVPGPEHLLARDGAIYTALHTGDVVKIVGENIQVLGKFGTLCCELKVFETFRVDFFTKCILDESDPKYICGRPLGLAFDTIGDNLIVMDTSSGIFELNLKDGKKKQLVKSTDVIGSSVRFNLVFRIHNIE